MLKECLLKRRENLTERQTLRLAELLKYNLRSVRGYLRPGRITSDGCCEPNSHKASEQASPGFRRVPFCARSSSGCGSIRSRRGCQ